MNKKRKPAEMTKLKQNRQDKQAIHQVQYFLRFAYFVAGFKIQKRDKYERALEMLCTAQG